jgi:hypothetical protein
MSWASENKFLIGFGAAVLAGAGTLGYLTFQAMGSHETALSELTAAKDELARVEGLTPFPNEAALKQLRAEKKELEDRLSAIQQAFKARVLPIEPIRKEAFQDLLKDTVATVLSSAAEAEVSLPDKFYLDYADYREKTPEEPAAPLLARQLRAIKIVIDLLINERRLELKELVRDRFSEEMTSPKPGESQPPPGKPATGQAARKLVEKMGFSMKLTCSDEALRRILNGIVGNKQQIFIIRHISIQNERQASPQKTAATVGPSTPHRPASLPASAVPPDGIATPAVNLEYAFGKERIEATIAVEALDFAEPEKRSGQGAYEKAK